MRRIVLEPGEVFTNKHLKRTGAFNAAALTAATSIIEGCLLYTSWTSTNGLSPGRVRWTAFCTRTSCCFYW